MGSSESVSHTSASQISSHFSHSAKTKIMIVATVKFACDQVALVGLLGSEMKCTIINFGLGEHFITKP